MNLLTICYITILIMIEYKLRIHDIPIDDRPTERLLKHGPETLSNAELLAVVLRTGTKQENIITLCQRVFSQYNLKQLSHVHLSELMKIHGIGPAKAAQISALFQLSRNLEVYNDDKKRKINSPDDVYKLLYSRMRSQKREHFVVILLDIKNNLIKDEIISIGTLNSSIVSSGEIYKRALLESCSSVIISHNHPSGDPAPSKQDILITKKLIEGGKLLDINILDHVIIGDGKYVSFKKEGFIN